MTDQVRVRAEYLGHPGGPRSPHTVALECMRLGAAHPDELDEAATELLAQLTEEGVQGTVMLVAGPGNVPELAELRSTSATSPVWPALEAHPDWLLLVALWHEDAARA